MAVELRRDPATKVGALKRVADQLGINPETLRNWVTQAEVDEGHRPGVTTEEAQPIAELEREVKELRRANEILRTASAFFAAAELDRKTQRRSLLLSWALSARLRHSPTPAGGARRRQMAPLSSCSSLWLPPCAG
jgi:transposase